MAELIFDDGFELDCCREHAAGFDWQVLVVGRSHGGIGARECVLNDRARPARA